MRVLRLVLSAMFLLSCVSGEAVAAKKQKNQQQQQKQQQQQEKQDRSKGSGFAVKAGKRGSGKKDSSDSWLKSSKQKDPF